MTTNGGRIDVDGADTFARTADAAADDLARLDQAHREAGDLLLDRADPPRDTGTLADSLYVAREDDTTFLTSDLDYFPYNTEFLAVDLDQNTDDVVDIFRDDVDRIAHTIHGT